MKEAEVEAAFVEHLRERGWDVTTQNANYTDVIASRGAQRIVAEVKGTTTSGGTDIDTLFGQLLRRMVEATDETRYAVVVPTTLLPLVKRVPESVRCVLGVDVWLVSEDGSVTLHGED